MVLDIFCIKWQVYGQLIHQSKLVEHVNRDIMYGHLKIGIWGKALPFKKDKIYSRAKVKIK